MILLTRLSLANRAIVALLTLLVVGVGLAATASMRQELLPSIEQPTAIVVVAKPGLSSTTLDQQVVVPLVQALSAVDGVDEVRSDSFNGSAQLSVTWPFGADGRRILDDIDSATSASLAGGPDGVTSQVFSGTTADLPVLALSITSGASLKLLGDRVSEALVPVIKDVPGVRDVEVSGLVQERVLVTADPQALIDKNIDISTITALLRTTGTVIPAGTSVDDDTSLAIEVGEDDSSLETIAALPIPTLDGPVPLSSVATVELVPVEQASISRANGSPAIGLTITKTPDANAVQVSHAVTAAVASALPQVGADAAMHSVFDQSTMVEESIDDLAVEGGLGVLFAVLVILVFLLSPRATIITAISIPLSLLFAIIGLSVGGFTLNVLTLAALTVAVGRVVDDSIVVIENIARRRAGGALTLQGVRESVAQVAGAVTASTLTTVAVFLPVAFVGGVAGELFRPFAVTVAVALVASLIVSLTIVPVLAYWLMRGPAKTASTAVAVPSASSDERVTALQRGYLPALALALRRPVTMIVVACIVFAGSLAAAGLLKTDLLGTFADARAIQVTAEMPSTATLGAADKRAAQLEDAIEPLSAVESYRTTVGSQGTPVILDLQLSADAEPDAALAEIEDALAGLPDPGSITVQTQATQTTSSTIDLIITGADDGQLSAASDALTAALRGVAGVGDITTDLAQARPVLTVSVDQTAAAAQGFSTVEVGMAIAAAVEGEPLGTVTIDQRTLDLVLRSQTTDTSVEAIRNLLLPVSVLQQQRSQKDGAAALTREQERLAAAARADAARAADQQLAALIDARAQSAQDLTALQQQLATVIANPPPADPTPVTAGELAAAQYSQLVSQLSGAVDGMRSGLASLDEQIASTRTAMAEAASQQNDADRLAQQQKDLENLRANPVRVGDVATVAVVDAPATVTRIDGVRAVTISVTPAGDDLGAAALAVDTALATVELPDGVALRSDGAVQEQAESFGQLGLAMLIAIALVYIVLVATFRSLLQPLVLLVSVPLAATGAIVGLLVTGTPLGIPALIGMLMLIGIVVTNAIVLIDLINHYRRAGAGIDDAVRHGARLRLRPIIMTASATIFALLPMALGFTGGGAFVSKSLAIVVIGGLVSSTLLTLLVVPALYVLQERRAERRDERRAARGILTP